MIKIDITNFDKAYDILESSFIPAELKPRGVLRKQWTEGKVSIWGIEDNEYLAGVITLWVFSDFVFVENFAVDESLRNKGIGARLLKEVVEKHKDKRIVLEVEPPENDLQKRRIIFYERNGFTLSPFRYIQPALRESCEDVQLQIMHTGDILKKDEFMDIRSDIFSTVYNC